MKNIYKRILGGLLRKLMKSENHQKGYFNGKQTNVIVFYTGDKRIVTILVGKNVKMLDAKQH